MLKLYEGFKISKKNSCCSNYMRKYSTIFVKVYIIYQISGICTKVK
jgi:hypothetical protein